ncbi:hypothetical protein EAO71_37200 [Streptomyces sp. ms191]|uniref:hypothetical protein n=1 Tax=Streptomyces sp. ms191 TaxID=1827978 RepID=UPI0011CE5AF3|nr:hypothetical protein [Streptomyces sp. ms191]TXS08240.1 hypothetical protein EAO71_37200 [Streptomyces sp. ms191]
MADDDTTTTDVTDDTGPATDTGQHDDVTAGLGEGGQKALAAERKARAAAEKSASAAQKKLDDMSRRLQAFEDRDKTEAQRLAERAQAAEAEAAKASSKLLRYEVASSKKLPPGWAGRLQGSTKEELEADADALLKELGETQQRRSPDYDGGVRKPAPAPTDMNALIRQKAGLG